MFALIDIPLQMNDGLSGQLLHWDPRGLLRSNGEACGTAFGAASALARRLHDGIACGLANFRHLTEYGAVRSSQCPPAHDCLPRHFMRRETATPVAAIPARCNARAMANCIYARLRIFIRNYIMAMAAGGKSAVQHGRKHPVRRALMSGL